MVSSAGPLTVMGFSPFSGKDRVLPPGSRFWVLNHLQGLEMPERRRD